MRDHVRANTAHWNHNASEWVEAGERLWSSEPVWGMWETPETDLCLLPDSMEGMDAIELGCGTGYVSGWMCRRGASVIGLDVSRRQLTTARRLAAAHSLDVGFVLADAEAVPFPDASFGFAMSEYGAALWCEPSAWLSETHRLLRPGGRLVLLSSSPWLAACYPLDGSTPAGTDLVRPYFGMERLDWTEVPIDPGGVEFVPTMSGWFRLFRRIGFAVDDYTEIQAPPRAQGQRFSVEAEWARRWPSEHVWILTRKG